VQVARWGGEDLLGANPLSNLRCGQTTAAEAVPGLRDLGKSRRLLHLTAVGFSQVPPPSAGPLDCVQSSCVRLNSTLQGQSWAFI